jgi:hypothetical protein
MSDGDIDGLDQGEASHERERLGRRAAIRKVDEGAAVEIAGCREPGTALSSATGILMKGNQPIALDGGFIGDQVGVGRTGALDDPDAGQKRLPAALSVSEPSGPISK